MVGALSKQFTDSFNKGKLTVVFSIFTILLLGACAAKSKSKAPEGAQGDDDVRKTLISTIENRGLAQVGESSSHKRSYQNLVVNGCTVLSDVLTQSVLSVSNENYKLSQLRDSASFAAPVNAAGESCKSVYASHFPDYARSHSHSAEKQELLGFLKDGCDFVRKQLEAQGLNLKECNISYKREADFASLPTGSVSYKVVFDGKTGTQSKEDNTRYFLTKFLWLNEFNESGESYLPDSEGNRREFSYTTVLNSVNTTTMAALGSEPLRVYPMATGERGILKKLKSSFLD